MTRQNATGTIPVRDPLAVVLELMQALAISVLDEHTDEAGLCVTCGWPGPVSPLWSLPTTWP
jgi:hypothetical protein